MLVEMFRHTHIHVGMFTHMGTFTHIYVGMFRHICRHVWTHM